MARGRKSRDAVERAKKMIKEAQSWAHNDYTGGLPKHGKHAKKPKLPMQASPPKPPAQLHRAASIIDISDEDDSAALVLARHKSVKAAKAQQRAHHAVKNTNAERKSHYNYDQSDDSDSSDSSDARAYRPSTPASTDGEEEERGEAVIDFAPKSKGKMKKSKKHDTDARAASLQREASFRKIKAASSKHHKVKVSEKTVQVHNEEQYDEYSAEVESETPEEIDSPGVRPEKLLELLKETEEFLNGIGKPADVHAFLQDYGFADHESTEAVRETCGSLYRLLRPSSHLKDEDPYEYRIGRIGHRAFELLAPVEVLHTDGGTLRSKTVGFLREQGRVNFQSIAVSGWSSTVKQHAKVINSERYTNAALEFCAFYKLKINTRGNIQTKAQEKPGKVQASHVEFQLIMYFAYQKLQEMTGRQYDVKKLDKLRQLRPRPYAEILLSDHPCPDCLRFRDKMEEITNISFTFLPKTNVAIIEKSERGTNRFPFYPKKAADPCTQDLMVSQRATTNMTSRAVTTTTTTMTTTQRRDKKKRKHHDAYEDDDSEDETYVPKGSKKQIQALVVAQPSTPKKSSLMSNYGYITPQSMEKTRLAPANTTTRKPTRIPVVLIEQANSPPILISPSPTGRPSMFTSTVKPKRLQQN
ncbi:hypothetical protein PVAG01_04967 [Phlyctema vagabunda]|uniref:Single-strand DNA deaminase toxin A-like C-terminal domain-containing protein n=1 Tax=Phlyctema vagabunda TaxID=108571 RepID=A0ABR4PIU6_9HELO